MQKLITYVSVKGHPVNSGGYPELLSTLASEVSKLLKDGWVVHGGVTIHGTDYHAIVVQTLVKQKQEQVQQQSQLPVRR